ncbi:hypothetical protein [Megamonas hypermegale]|uniref:hypothetical protein n=1 Tax=Megamonas hypermegale TaxID=158847 RepID=UPI0025A3A5C1|nr:hypothetical protein [Megamonas hypermegale]MDM8143692.1 hypothetical protein [Megamonas hypermegale]
MKILGRILGLMTIAIFFSMPAVFAENVEWENKGVDFKSIKTVYIEPEIEYYDGVNLFDVTNADLLNIVKENQKYVKKYKIVPNKETTDLILKVSVMDWNKRDEYMYKYTDIAYDTTVTYEDEYGNKAYTKTPYVNEYGGYYKHYDYFSMKGTVMTNDGYVAYIYIDNREAQKDNINMFERAVKNFFKKFNGTK